MPTLEEVDCNDDDNGDEPLLYRRMKSSADSIRRIIIPKSQSPPPPPAAVSLFDQALLELEFPSALYRGIKVWKITKSSDFVPRYLSITPDHQSLSLTHSPPPPSSSTTTTTNTKRRRRRRNLSLWNRLFGRKRKQDRRRQVHITDIHAWQVGAIATTRAEIARVQDDSFEKLALGKLLTVYYTTKDNEEGGGEEENGTATWDFIVPKINQLRKILKALDEMYNICRDIQPWASPDILLMQYILRDMNLTASTSNDNNNRKQTIHPRELQEICVRFNLVIPPKNNNTSPFTFQKCLDLIQGMKPHGNKESPMVVLWEFLFGKDTTVVSPQDFYNEFLIGVQSESKTSIKHAKALIWSINAMEIATTQRNKRQQEQLITKNNTLQRSYFYTFLLSEMNSAYDPEIILSNNERVLNRPITEYWINTSHHSHLPGNEMKGIGPVTEALLRGCKCFFLDCWDGPIDDEQGGGGGKPIPVVDFSGRRIKLDHVCQVVYSYLKIHSSSYPIILCLKNQCSIQFQERVPEILRNTLGRKLFQPQSITAKPMPSPEALRGKVVIMASSPSTHRSILKMEEASAAETSNAVGDSDSTGPFHSLALVHGISIKTLPEAFLQPQSQMISLSEAKIQQLITNQDDATSFRGRNKSHLTSSYPATQYPYPANYNPIYAWSLGIQMVALDFQTGNKDFYLLNDGLFRQNSNCGYVHKTDCFSGTRTASEANVIFVRILSGSCLPRPNSHAEAEGRIVPHVSVTLYDIQIKEKGTEEVSTDEHTTHGNGFYAPLFDDSGKKFSVQRPQVAMLLFKMSYQKESTERTDGISLSAAIPVSHLKKGYRSIQLYDSNNLRSGIMQYGTLLAHIEY